MTTDPDRGDGDGDGERGAGTVLVLALVAVVLLMMGFVAALGAAHQARGTAQSAADLGALAGATALRWGHDPCSTAAATMRRNGAEPVACDVEHGGVVAVTAARTAVGPGGSWGALGRAEASARAGPTTARQTSGDKG